MTTDTELIWLFEKVDNDHVNAKLRIASYLNAQSDKLYFEAKNQAVSYLDYDLKLSRASVLQQDFRDIEYNHEIETIIEESLI